MLFYWCNRVLRLLYLAPPIFNFVTTSSFRNYFEINLLLPLSYPYYYYTLRYLLHSCILYWLVTLMSKYECCIRKFMAFIPFINVRSLGIYDDWVDLHRIEFDVYSCYLVYIYSFYNKFNMNCLMY